MDEFSVEVTGLKEVQAMLDSLSKQEGDRCIRKALKAGALVEQAAITEVTPIKDGTGGLLPDGALKSDIEIHFKRDSDGIQQAIVGPGKYTAHVARMVEYGHRLVRGGYNKLIKFGPNAGKTRGPGQVIGEVEEHSFIRKGYEASRQEVIDTICSTLATEITKAAKNKGKAT